MCLCVEVPSGGASDPVTEARGVGRGGTAEARPARRIPWSAGSDRPSRRRARLGEATRSSGSMESSNGARASRSRPNSDPSPI